MKLKLIVVAISLALVTGCTPPSQALAAKLKEHPNYSNVTIEDRGYVSYIVEQRDGTLLSCRDHSSRSELTCWPVELE
jgi:hypothetical protein